MTLSSKVAARFAAEEFRSVLGRFGTGVVIVTATYADEPVGLTCNSFSSVSLEPPLVLFCPAKMSTSWPRIAQAGEFCINVLGDSQRAVCASFARTGVDKFVGVETEPARYVAAPRLVGALAHLECEIADVHEAGDHFIVVGRVLALTQSQGTPLLFYRGSYGGFRP
jgi:3-hydroxy-9,10-secoandrosta-1,3,5(10)-triene-9,17-dione monooxygenase reductase component